MILKGLMAARAVYDIIERVPTIMSEPGCSKQVELEKAIHFEKVSFRYPTQVEGTRDIFSGASFDVLAGQSTAIVGPRGSGKSTIV